MGEDSNRDAESKLTKLPVEAPGKQQLEIDRWRLSAGRLLAALARSLLQFLNNEMGHWSRCSCIGAGHGALLTG